MPTPSFLPGLGGMEVGLHNIATRLVGRGYDVTVIAPPSQCADLRRDGFQAVYRLKAFPPKLINLGLQRPDAAITLLKAYFRLYALRHAPDVWHCTMAWPLGVALAQLADHPAFRATLMRSAGADIQVDDRIGYGVRLNPAIDALVRRWVSQLPALVAITETVAAEYRVLGVPDSRIHAIPNGVDTARFQRASPMPDIRARHGIGPSTFLFLGVGRHHPKKNFSRLIPAMRFVLDRQPDADVALVLAGQDMGRLQQDVDAAGLKKRIILLDRIAPPSMANGFELPADELLAWYKTANAFVFPSLIETFGIALVEAMAAGLPVLTADAPGCRDIVDHGRYGLMFDPLDTVSVGEAMLRVLLQPALRADLAEKSLNRAGVFDWEAIVSRYEDLYGRLRGGGA